MARLTCYRIAVWKQVFKQFNRLSLQRLLHT